MSAPQRIVVSYLLPVVPAADRLRHIDKATHASKTVDLFAELEDPFDILASAKDFVVVAFPINCQNTLANTLTNITDVLPCLFDRISTFAIVICPKQLATSLAVVVL